MSDNHVIFPGRGQTEKRLLTFQNPLLGGEEWPYFAISGAHDGPTLCLIAGIHGAEYPPIDAVMRFCAGMDPTTLHGRIVGMPVVNLPAFWDRTPFVNPRDGKNPNRTFPGNGDGTYTEVLAHHIFESVIRQGDYLVDLHGGDMVEDLVPFSLVQETGQPDLDDRALDIAITFGLPYVVSQAPSGGPVAGTTNAAAAAVGIPAVIAEAGGVGQLQTEAVDLHLRGLHRVLRRLRMLDGDLEPQALPTRIKDFVWLRAERGGFFRKAVSAGETLRKGAPIGQIVDLWGTAIDEVLSPVSGVALFVTTSPAIRDGGLLIGIGVPA
jgi:predicted deacylase